LSAYADKRGVLFHDEEEGRVAEEIIGRARSKVHFYVLMHLFCEEMRRGVMQRNAAKQQVHYCLLLSRTDIYSNLFFSLALS